MVKIKYYICIFCILLYILLLLLRSGDTEDLSWRWVGVCGEKIIRLIVFTPRPRIMISTRLSFSTAPLRALFRRPTPPDHIPQLHIILSPFDDWCPVCVCIFVCEYARLLYTTGHG